MNKRVSWAFGMASSLLPEKSLAVHGLGIPSAGLISFLDRNPSIAAKFYKRMAMGFAQRLKYMNEDFAILKTFLIQTQ